MCGLACCGSGPAEHATPLRADLICKVLLPHLDGLPVRSCAHRLARQGPPESWQRG